METASDAVERRIQWLIRDLDPLLNKLAYVTAESCGPLFRVKCALQQAKEQAQVEWARLTGLDVADLYMRLEEEGLKYNTAEDDEANDQGWQDEHWDE